MYIHFLYMKCIYMSYTVQLLKGEARTAPAPPPGPNKGLVSIMLYERLILVNNGAVT